MTPNYHTYIVKYIVQFLKILKMYTKFIQLVSIFNVRTYFAVIIKIDWDYF